MESKKMIGTIEKKLDVKVEKVLGVTQEGKEIQVDVSTGSGNCMKVCLKEMKNQYGPYYKITFSESYEMPVEEKKPASKKSAKLRTKTEQLCGANRKAILDLAEKTIRSVADGTARIKEIEGPHCNDTTIRFVLLRTADGERFKEDISVSEIANNIA